MNKKLSFHDVDIVLLMSNDPRKQGLLQKPHDDDHNYYFNETFEWLSL